jgi:DtxR family Mn-dependent transcriptional regulator
MMAESESTEMYLKSIFELGEQGEPVPISNIAQRLGVSSVSANEMIKRLAERDMVVHTPYKGVELSPSGKQRAVIVLRRHRLWERFLVDHLGIPWADAHDPACRMEHVTPNEVADALDIFLGNPKTCPHGNPIPTSDGKLETPDTTRLSELAIGQAGTVSYIYPEETILLEYLAERRLFPGAAISVEDLAPYNGPLTLLVDGEEVILGREVAAHLAIRMNGE